MSRGWISISRVDLVDQCREIDAEKKCLPMICRSRVVSTRGVARAVVDIVCGARTGKRAKHNSWLADGKLACLWPCHRNLNGDISIRTRRRGVIRGSVRHKRATAPHPVYPPLRQGTQHGHACRGDREYYQSSVLQQRASLISINRYSAKNPMIKH